MLPAKFIRRLPVALAWIVLGSGTAVWALQVTPARQELSIVPGGTHKSFIDVTNDTPERVHIDVSKKDWFVSVENKGISVDQWLEVRGKLRFDLKPRETRRVALVLRCPKNARGELVGMVSFMYLADQPSMVTPVISVSVYVAAKGTEKIAGEIKDVVPRFWENKLHVGVQVRSLGNVHLRPKGTVTLNDLQNGRELSRTAVDEGPPAYPGSDRVYMVLSSSEPLKPGRYSVEATLVSRGLEMIGRRDFTVLKDGSVDLKDETNKVP